MNPIIIVFQVIHCKEDDNSVAVIAQAKRASTVLHQGQGTMAKAKNAASNSFQSTLPRRGKRMRYIARTTTRTRFNPRS